MDFFARSTNQGTKIKVLVELLNNVLGTGQFTVSKEGISLSCCNAKETVLIVLSLRREKFDEYKCSKERKFSIDLSALQRVLKTVKKKDGIMLSINSSNPDILNITMLSADRNGTLVKKEEDGIFIKDSYALNVEVPEDYNHPHILSSTEFHKMCRKFDILRCNTVTVETSKENYICFSGQGEKTSTSRHVFGEEQGAVEYSEDFQRTSLCMISKLSGLHERVAIYTPEESPCLKIETEVGSLGNVAFYIKRFKSVISEEQKKVES